MTISLMAEVAWCACALLLVPLTARAEGDQITFSGSIVESTCSSAIAENMAIAGATPNTASGTRQTCATPGNAAAAASRIYALTVIRLSSSVPDRVLKYFDTYVRASRTHATDPVLLTQTYE